MRATALGLGALLLLPLLFAGCTQSTPASTPPATAVPAKVIPAKGILLRVLVITDEYFPVAKARVTLVGLGVNGTTDEWGDAFFHVAQSGRYALHVHRAGFYPNQTKVVLEEGASAATVRVRLSDAPGHSHYSDFYFYTGLCGPTVWIKGVSTTSDCTETRFFQKPQARFILGAGLVRGYIEMSWTDHPAGAREMRMEVRFPEIGAFADGRDVIIAEGANPIQLTIPQELLTERHLTNGNTLTITVGLSQRESANLNAQHEFQIDAEFGYLLEAPDVDPET